MFSLFCDVSYFKEGCNILHYNLYIYKDVLFAPDPKGSDKTLRNSLTSLLDKEHLAY